MIQGSIQITLLMGAVVPVPAPRVVMDALQSVTVTSSVDSASGFQMQFAFNSSSELNTLFMIAPALSSSVATPPLRLLLVVTVNGTAKPLLDGVMTNVQVQAGQNGGAGSINVTGDDLTRVMDTQEYDGLPYPAMPIAARVALICAKYAAYGIVPLVVPEIFPEVDIPIDKIPAQQGTDLNYIKQLAEQVGYVFYIEPGLVPGTNIAYFGPSIKTGPIQSPLNVDMGPHTNVESVNFSFDPTQGVLPVVLIQNQQTRFPIPLPIPNINPLQLPQAAIPTTVSNINVMKDTAKMSPGKALLKGLAEAARSQDSVSAQGDLDVLSYGQLLKARESVGLRGAGLAYDGLYFVTTVTTTLSGGQIKQSFELSRNGLVSLTPRVPV